MKMEFLDNFRHALNQKYLDWAEDQLPNSKFETISVLREIRKHQRIDSEETFLRTRPPAGVELSYLYFRLVEVFTLENFPALRDGLLKLFPRLRNDFRSSDFSSDFDREAEKLRGISWRNIGWVLREASDRRLAMDPFRVIPQLPQCVEVIQLQTYQILPSIIVLTVDVILTDAATEHLSKLQSRKYVGTLESKQFFPWKLWQHGFSESFASEELRLATTNWLSSLRSRVEKCLEPFVAGHYMKRSGGDLARLPAIEILTLRRKREQDTFQQCHEKARDWFDSYGFDFFFDAVSDGASVFTWPRERHFDRKQRQGIQPFRLLILWDSYVKGLDSQRYGNDERYGVIHTSQYLLRAMLPTITLLQFLSFIQMDIAALRRIAFESVALGSRFGRYVRLSLRLQQQAIVLGRLAADFEQHKNLLKRKMEGLEEFKFLGRSKNAEHDNFKDSTLQGVSDQIAFLDRQLALIAKLFSEFVSLKNMRAMHVLQWILLVLTIVTTITALLGVIANWETVSKFLRFLISD